jgi:hypothetical protein
MPQEFSDYAVFHQPQIRDELVTYTAHLKSLAETLPGNLPLMISPFFGQNPNGQAYANWWDTTGLPLTGIDIFNLQDGVGTHRTTIAQSQAVFAAMAPVMQHHGVAFWANNESFNQIHGWPVDDGPFQAIPADIMTLVQQIQATTPLVDKSVTFEFTTYMSTQGSGAANVLYHDYGDYFQSVLSSGGDFNGDGAYDCADINALTNQIALGTDDLAFDLTGDGAVDLADRDAWLAEAGAANLTSGNPYRVGDANLNGAVDVSDFNLWNESKFTDVSRWCYGDFNADGSVDVSDFNLWNGNRFLSADSGDTLVVPEPASMVGLLSLAVCLVLSIRTDAIRMAKRWVP